MEGRRDEAQEKTPRKRPRRKIVRKPRDKQNVHTLCADQPNRSTRQFRKNRRACVQNHISAPLDREACQAAAWQTFFH